MNVFHNQQHENCLIRDNQNNSEKTTNPYKSLWRAVILQVLIDASSNSKKKILRKRKIEAQIWLSCNKNKNDLKTICALAGLDFEKSQENIKKALLNNCRWRKINKQHN